MVIGVDIDGVLYQTEGMFREYSEKYNKLIGGKIVDDTELKAGKRYNWTKEQINDFMQNSYYEVEKKAPLFDMAKEILGVLKKTHKIVFITARGHISDNEKPLTLKRLADDGILYDDILFSNRSKVQACKDAGVDIMIDDNPNVIDELLENGVNCLYFRDMRNKPCQNSVIELYSWKEIGEFFRIVSHKPVLTLGQVLQCN